MTKRVVRAAAVIKRFLPKWKPDSTANNGPGFRT
jgi:hypothetical protein